MSKELIKKLSNIIKEAKDIYPDVDEKIYKKHGAKNMINKDGSLKVDKTEKNESKNKSMTIEWSYENPNQYDPLGRIYNKLIITKEQDGTFSWNETDNLEHGQGFKSAVDAFDNAVYSGEFPLEDYDDFEIEATVKDVEKFFNNVNESKINEISNELVGKVHNQRKRNWIKDAEVVNQAMQKRFEKNPNYKHDKELQDLENREEKSFAKLVKNSELDKSKKLYKNEAKLNEGVHGVKILKATREDIELVVDFDNGKEDTDYHVECYLVSEDEDIFSIHIYDNVHSNINPTNANEVMHGLFDSDGGSFNGMEVEIGEGDYNFDYMGELEDLILDVLFNKRNGIVTNFDYSKNESVSLEDEANKIGNDKKLLLKRLKDGLSVLKNEYKKEFKDYEYDFENKALHSKTSDLSLIWKNNGRTSEGSVSLYKNKGENKMNENESGYLNDDEIASFYKDFEIVSIDNLKKNSTIWNGEEQFYYTGDIVIKFPNADADYDEFAWEETYDDFIAHKEDGTKVAFDKWYPDFVYNKLSSEVTKAIQAKFPPEVKDVEGIMRIGSKGDTMYRDNKTGEYYIARNEKDRPAYNKTFRSEEELLTWAEKVGLMESKINEALDSKIKIFLTNLGKYNEGDLVGEWVELPVDDFQPILDRIGINDEYEEWFITDYEAPFEIGEYDDIDELNEIAEAIENFNATELEVLKTYEENGYDMQTAIEKVRDNDYFYLQASNEEDLAYAYIESIGNLDDAVSKEDQERYFDYESFGRDLVLGGDYSYVQDVVDLNEFADKDTAEMVFGEYGEDKPSEEDLNKYRQWIEIYNNYDESQYEQLEEQGIFVHHNIGWIEVDGTDYDISTLEQIVDEDYETKTGYQDNEGYIVEVYSERELAEYIVDSLYRSVSELGENTLQRYFDYEAFGRDLSYDFYKTDNGYVRLD